MNKLLILIKLVSVIYLVSTSIKAGISINTFSFYSHRKDWFNRVQNEVGFEFEPQFNVGMITIGTGIGYARSFSSYYKSNQKKIFNGPQFEDVMTSVVFQFPVISCGYIELLQGIGGTGIWTRTRSYIAPRPPPFSDPIVIDTTQKTVGVHENSGAGGGFLRTCLLIDIHRIIIGPYFKLFINFSSLRYNKSSPIYPSVGLQLGIKLK